MQYVRYEVLQTCSEDMRWPYHPIRPAHATKIRLETRCLAVLGLLGWEPGSLPGFNATFHVADIGKAHVLEGLCRDRTQGPNHTVGDDRARAIVQPHSGSLRNGSTDEVAPFSPRAVIFSNLGIAEQILQHEPCVTR
jgi:hypothetical protein